MKFSDEHKALYDTVKDFAINEIKPFADEWEENEKFPAHELFKKWEILIYLGLLKIRKMEEWV